MPKLTFVLTERDEALIESLVKSGRYRNASEVVHEGLRLIEDIEADDAAKLEALRRAIRVGEESAARGEVTRFDNAEDLGRHLDRLADRAMKRHRTD